MVTVTNTLLLLLTPPPLLSAKKLRQITKLRARYPANYPTSHVSNKPTPYKNNLKIASQQLHSHV